MEMMSRALRLQEYTEDSVSLLTTLWSELPISNFMQTPAWLFNAWKEIHRHQAGVDRNSFHGMVVNDSEGQPVGGSLWFRRVSHAIEGWKMVGSGSICTDYTQMPSCAGFEQEVGELTAEWFDEMPKKRFGMPISIEVDGYSVDSLQWQSFFGVLLKRGWSLDKTEIEGAWRLQLPESWQEYEMLLHKSHRRKARRAIKLLESREIEHYVARGVTEIESLWPVFVELHQKRRLLLGQAGCFADSHFERFLKMATLELANQNHAWLSCVKDGDSPVAMLLCFDWGDTSYLYQSGIDTDRMDLEPGHLVNAATIRTCIEVGQKSFDFLRGDERYKADWRASRSRLGRCLAFSPGFAGRHITSAQRLRRNILNWVKRRSGQSSVKEGQHEVQF